MFGSTRDVTSGRVSTVVVTHEAVHAMNFVLGHKQDGKHQLQRDTINEVHATCRTSTNLRIVSPLFNDSCKYKSVSVVVDVGFDSKIANVVYVCSFFLLRFIKKKNTVAKHIRRSSVRKETHWIEDQHGH